MSAYTAEEDDFVTREWKAGLSASHIASKLPGRSRNSVIGRVNRLGLKRRDQPQAKPRPPRAALSKKRPNMGFRMNGRLNKIDAWRNPPAPKSVLAKPDGTSRVLLDDMPRFGRCRFPLWPDNAFPKSDEMFFCGEVIEGEATYCGVHAERCFNPLPYHRKPARVA